jgi:mono/diheme cytochrome c family protein
MKRLSNCRFWLAVLAALLCIAADGTWMERVPDADRAKSNPFSGKPDAVAAGQKVYLDHCAKCHGDDGEGRRKKPSLRTGRVQHATDGEIFWLLKNGSVKKGMPIWSSLPEPTRWQIIAFVKSMGTSSVQNDLQRYSSLEEINASHNNAPQQINASQKEITTTWGDAR